MADKIIILTNSPRKHGNTNTVTQWVIEGAPGGGGNGGLCCWCWIGC